jgi:hypothetical protein
MDLVRLSEWPRHPFLNDEVREWIALHLQALGVSDVAMYAIAVGREEDQRRILVATEVGLLDSWYAPRGSSARYGLSVRLYPWQAVRRVDLRGETSRLWAHEHETRWRLQISRPALDILSETPELGRALTQFAAACAIMAEPAGQMEESSTHGMGPAAIRQESTPAIPIEPELNGEAEGEAEQDGTPLDLARRLGLPQRD